MRPGDDREGAVARRLASAGAARTGADVEHPAGAERDLGPPGRTQPWPTSDACWSPTSAAIGGRRAAPSPRRARRRSRRAAAASPAGMPSSVEDPARSTPTRRSGSRPVTAAFGVVGDVQRAAGQRPRQPRVDGAEAQVVGVRPSTWSSSQASLVADWFGARPSPCSALATMHSPTVRRSCQPSAGPIGSPVARSHTIVLARWLVMPTGVIGSSTDVEHLGGGVEHEPPSSAASNSTRPGNGRRRRERPRSIGDDHEAVVDDAPPAALVVPMSITRIIDASLSGSTPLAGAGRGARRAAGGEHGGEVEEHGEPVDVEAPDEADRHEHDLGGEVGADGRDEPVAERRADPLHPAAHPAPSTKPITAPRLSHTASVVRPGCRPPSAGDRQRDGEHEAPPRPAPDRVPSQRRHDDRSRPRRRAERRGQAELARVEDPARVERLLERRSRTPNAGPSASPTNRARLSPTPWWCGQVAAVGEHGPLAGVPQGDVRSPRPRPAAAWRRT